jgi:hypothetical protein
MELLVTSVIFFELFSYQNGTFLKNGMGLFYEIETNCVCV